MGRPHAPGMRTAPSASDMASFEPAQRLDRGEVTLGQAAASLGRSARQVQWMRKRFAGKGAAGLVHGNAGRRPKHGTSQEAREQVMMLRRQV